MEKENLKTDNNIIKLVLFTSETFKNSVKLIDDIEILESSYYDAEGVERDGIEVYFQINNFPNNARRYGPDWIIMDFEQYQKGIVMMRKEKIKKVLK